MMRWFVLGMFLGLLVAVPELGAPVATLAAGVATQPLVLAFILGLICRKPLGRSVRGWAA